MTLGDKYDLSKQTVCLTGTQASVRLCVIMAAQLEGDLGVTYHLAPPMLPGRDPAIGRPRKRQFGPWIKLLMHGLARLRWLRGSWADAFGYTQERKTERRLIGEYRAAIETVLSELIDETLNTALALAQLPDNIRGFGPVKHTAIESYKTKRAALLGQLHAAPATKSEAA